MRILIFAAYLLAAVLPVLALGEGRGQSQVDHAQMMAMAGHLMPMQTTDGPDSDAQQVLCQQHCLFAAAALPAPNGGTEVVVRAAAVEAGSNWPFSSLAVSPPGHPPKIAVI